jgi:hypothetical protein
VNTRGEDVSDVERAKMEQRAHMRSLWLKAMFNMPWGSTKPVYEARRDGSDTNVCLGQLHALADCLELKPHRVKRSMIHGSIPENPQTLHLLERFASHYGSRFAGIRLAAVGALHKYPNWPSR